MTAAGSISGYGLTAALPPGWEGRITKLAPQASLAPPASTSRASGARPETDVVETTMPFMHLANFPLPPRRGAFGTGAVELMSGADALIVLFEYAANSARTALFAPSGLPRVLYPRAFDPRALQRILPGQAGYQAFFTEAGRPFSLYAVLGSQAQATTSVPAINRVLASLQIDPA